MKILAFKNEGTDCYINSVLQVLYTQIEFITYLHYYRNNIINYENDEDLSYKQIIGIKLIKSLTIVLSKLYNSDKIDFNMEPKIVNVYMEEFRQIVLNSFGDKFTSYTGQKDAHEFMKKLLDFLNAGLLVLFDESIIDKLFSGKLDNFTQCLECGNKSKIEECIDLTIPINLAEKTDIQTYINNYFDVEELDENNKWFCDKCQQKQMAIKYSFINKYPELLMLSLSRFEFDIFGSKIRKDVIVNETIELFDQKYTLSSLIIHSGNNLEFGHYTALVKYPNNKWYLCDDTTISVEKQLLIKNNHTNKDVYLLFYRKMY